MKKRFCLLIPDGVGIRNYLYSDVLKHIKAAGHEVVIWHSLSEDVIKKSELRLGKSIEAHAFESFPDSFFIRLFREASTFARLQINAKEKQNDTILTNWNAKRNTVSKKALYWLAEKLGKSLKTYEAVEKLERKIYTRQLKTYAFKKHQEQLKAMNIDLLFCTHQRVPYLVTAMLAAKHLGIKTVTAIFSWDNLPKARLPFRADQYLVWSDYMSNELLTFYPEIEKECISITSTPQFDFYRDEKMIQTREVFAKKYGLDVYKKWVLFSGDDVTTSPYDAHYLEDVADALKQEKNIQLIFRQVPVESIKRYEAILVKYKNIKHVSPLWIQSDNWAGYYPLISDISLLANLAKHCSVVINVGSTLALDFANFNNPSLYINYNQPHSANWSVEVIYRFQHFRTMEGLNPVGWINSKEEILDKVKTALRDPDEIGPDRLKWLGRIVQPYPNKTASERIAEALVNTILE
jgi:hypothetical protein